MKKIGHTVLLLLVLALLTGCACEHEWTQPDCLNPAVCTKCEEPGAEALGHDWAEATCTEAEICTRCGKTRGEALGHSYGDWIFGGEDMTHVCSACNAEETTEIDRGLYLGTLLPGHWDVFGVYQDDDFSFIQDLVYVDLHLYFDPDGGAVLTTPENGTVQGTWSFSTYEQREKSNRYYVTLTCGETSYILWLEVLSDSSSILPEKMLVLYATNQQIYLTRYDEAAQVLASDWKVAMDKWGSADGNMANWLSFREDRTVAGHLNGPVEGRWLLVPLLSSGDTVDSPSRCGIVIFPEDEEDELFQLTLSLGDDVKLSMYLDDYYHAFEPATPKDMEAVKAAAQIPLGTWTSTAVYYQSGTEDITTDYSFTFLENGTFTADLGREYGGTWMVSDVDDSGYYRYSLYFTGSRREVGCTIDSRNEKPENAELSISEPPQFEDHRMTFARLTEEEAEQILQGPTLPIGSWISTSLLRIQKGTEQRESTRTREYSITFREDGTFTALLDTEITGTWEFKTMHHEESPSFEYWLYIGDSHTQMFIHDDGGTMNFSFHNYDPDYRLTYYFEPLKEGMEEALALGPTFPIGTWTSWAAYYQVKTAEGVEVENYTYTDDYFLTFHEDGTLTALLDQEKTGTWEYIDLREFCSERDGQRYTYFSWEYRLTFQGESEPQQHFIRCDGGRQLSIIVPDPENQNREMVYLLGDAP